MIPIVAAHGAERESLCRRYSVLRLELFGSAATGEYHPADSDIDFLIEFKEWPAGSHADAYFGLLNALDRLFGGPVDLIVDSAIKKPYCRQSVDQTKELLYAA